MLLLTLFVFETQRPQRMQGAVALRSGNAYISDDDTLISL